MKITINNRVVEYDNTKHLSIQQVLATQALPENGIGVALNNKVVPHSQWATTIVNDGDTLTVIRAICGG